MVFTLLVAIAASLTNVRDSLPVLSPHYRLVDSILTDSGGVGLLAVDWKTRRLYGAGNSVVDIDHNVIVAHLPAVLGHGYAIATDLDRVVTRRAAIIDGRTFAVLDSGIGRSASTVVYDAATHRAFIIGDSTLVIDVRTRATVGRLWLGSTGVSAAVDNQGHVYADLMSDSIVSFNSRTLRIERRFGMNGCERPEGLAYATASRRLFVSCNNHQLIAIDVNLGHVVATTAVAGGAEEIAFDSVSRLIFNPTGMGTMSIIHQDAPDRYTALPDVATAEGGPVAAVDPVTQRVFLVRPHMTDRVRIFVFAP